MNIMFGDHEPKKTKLNPKFKIADLPYSGLIKMKKMR